ncbi:MAG: class I adenylate-forming enzyme family protein [Acetobacteraceae bacterium]
MTRIGASDRILRSGRLTVYELFHSRAKREPDALAIEAIDARVTYGELDERVQRLAGGLHARGIGRGDRIAVVSENRVEYVELELAAAFLGAIVACQNWRLSNEELAHCIRIVTPRIVVASRRYFAATKRTAPDCPIIVIEDDWQQLPANKIVPPDDVDQEDGLVILYTSGTTGMPKGALISHRAEIARMAVLRMDLRVTERDAFVAWAPLYHMASNDQTLGTLMSGAPVIVVDGFDVSRIVQAVSERSLGWLLLMPGSIEPVVEALKRARTKPVGVRVVGAMADLVPTPVIAEISRLVAAAFLNSFGSTETGLPPCSNALIPSGAVPTSFSKRQSSLCEIRLVDPDGAEVPTGQIGEMAVRGPTVFSGYWEADEVNARDFSDGYFRMGDLFRRNSDGSYDFVDRAKYMIKSGGENIYPAEIERVLLSDPRIADAVVVRRPDERWGEVPVAFIAPKVSGLTEEDIEALCRQKLASYKRPKAVRFIAFEDFPRSTTGKIQRHEIEKWL